MNARLSTERLQGLGVALAAASESEIGAHGNVTGPKRVEQHRAHEVFCAEQGQILIKGHQHQLLNSQRLQQREFLVWQIEPQSGFTVQHFPGMGPETHHRG